MSQYRNLGKRREGGGAWRWLVMGAVLAFGFSAALFLAALTFEWATLGVPSERHLIATGGYLCARRGVANTLDHHSNERAHLTHAVAPGDGHAHARNANSPTGRERPTAPWRR